MISPQGNCATCHQVLALDRRGFGTLLCEPGELKWYKEKFSLLIEAFRERKQLKGEPNIPHQL